LIFDFAFLIYCVVIAEVCLPRSAARGIVRKSKMQNQKSKIRQTFRGAAVFNKLEIRT
jgi:hypothetical protein